MASVPPTRLRPLASRAVVLNPTEHFGQAYARVPSLCTTQREPSRGLHAAGARTSQPSVTPPSLASAMPGTRCRLVPCAAAPGRDGAGSWSRLEDEVGGDEEEGRAEEGEDEGEEPVMSRARARRLEKGRQKREERQREQDRIFQEFSR